MNLITYERSETLVNKLMPCQGPLTLELARNHEHFEVSIVRADDFDSCIVKTGLDQTTYLDWVHTDKKLR